MKKTLKEFVSSFVLTSLLIGCIALSMFFGWFYQRAISSQSLFNQILYVVCASCGVASALTLTDLVGYFLEKDHGDGNK